MNKESTPGETAAYGGEEFVKMYFSRFDTSQRLTLVQTYKEESILLWDGNLFKGTKNIEEFFKRLSPTKHNYETIDCQPIHEPGSTQVLLVVSLSGIVNYSIGEQQQQTETFHRSFVLAQDAQSESKFYVVSDCFRTIQSTK